MFDLEDELKNWRKTLTKEQGLEPGYIEELESNLLDRYDDLIAEGKTETEAFNIAKKKCFTDSTEVADEFYKSRSPLIDKTPPWRKNYRLFNLLPSFLKVALRSFNRTKAYTFINYLGLTIGLLVTCFVGLYIKYELSWDKFHSNSDRIYRVGQQYRSQGYSLISFDNFYNSTRETQLTQAKGFGNTLGVEDVAQFWIFGSDSYLIFDEQRFSQNGLLSTNTPASFFNIFDWKFMYGSPDAFSANTYQAVLNKTTAQKINNGDEATIGNLIGKEFLIDTTSYKIVGIIRDIPPNSHYEFNIALHDPRIEYWGGRTYVLLDEQAEIEEVKKLWEDNIAQINPRFAKNEDGLFKGFVVHDLESMHLQANLLYEEKPAGDKRYLYIFGIIGTVILLITLTNYTNLSIAMYAGRNREIGMRKVMGAGQLQIAGQFIMESVLISILAVPFVLILLSWLLPYFNNFMGVDIRNHFLQSLPFFFLLISFGIILGLISGIYPALMLSGKKIKSLFDNQISNPNTRGFTLRKSLITFQFVLLIGLGSATFLINSQLKFINQKDIGYAKEGIVYVLMEDSSSYSKFKQLLGSETGVKEVGKGTPLASQTYNQTTYSIDGFDEIFDDGYNMYMNADALKAYGIKTTVDIYFENSANAPEKLMLLNQSGAEKFAAILGINKEELIGKTFRIEPEYIQKNGTIGFPYQIDGFFEDINMFSLKEKINPYFLEVRSEVFIQYAIISFNPLNTSQVIEGLEAAYDQLGQSFPMYREFQEDRLRELYEQDQRVASLVIYLSILAFLMALMGLIGLTAYLTTIKKKEVGIRKILGASNSQIILMLNKEYIFLITSSLVIASPFVYLGMSKWLSGFAYKISINPVVFILTALCTLVITLIVVSSQTFKIANDDPVNALRNDQ